VRSTQYPQVCLRTEEVKQTTLRSYRCLGCFRLLRDGRLVHRPCQVDKVALLTTAAKVEHLSTGWMARITAPAASVDSPCSSVLGAPW
jgi:hypothetical protein